MSDKKELGPDHFIIDGKWHHIATIKDGDMYRTYYDGKLIGEADSDLHINKDFEPEE